MITSNEYETLWKRYSGRICNEGCNRFTFWWSRHKKLCGEYTIDYDALDFGDDEDIGPFAGRTTHPKNQEEFIIIVDALTVNTEFDQDEHGILRIKYTPIYPTNDIKLYTIEEAYKYFDRVLTISKNLNMPSFNMDVHRKIERYHSAHYDVNIDDEAEADIVFRKF